MRGARSSLHVLLVPLRAGRGLPAGGRPDLRMGRGGLSALAGRRALVTGAGSGTGRAIAIGLGEAGAGVVLAGRRPEPIEETAEHVQAHGVKALAVPTDVGNPDQVRALIDATRSELGGIDA